LTFRQKQKFRQILRGADSSPRKVPVRRTDAKFFR